MNTFSTLSLALTVSMLGSLQTAEALPRNANGTVISGAATIVDTDVNTTTINQTSDIAEINWSDFDLTSAQTVQFNTPRSESISINRVTSGSASAISGLISSNAQVYLINEHGITFGNGASFNAETFTVSTIDSFNAEADVNQYAEIIFDSSAYQGSHDANRLTVIAPFIGFYSNSSHIAMDGYNMQHYYSANRATVEFTGANNDIAVTVPDVQPDVIVPMGKQLGIQAKTGPQYIIFNANQVEMVAKAVSVAQNIDALINLDTTSNATMVVRGTNYLGGLYDASREYNLDLYSAGHILMEGHINIGRLYNREVTASATNRYTPQDTRFVAEKNIFIESFRGAVNDIYIEAGANLILNNGRSRLDASNNDGVYGKRTIKLGSGTLAVENGNYDFSTLSDIETYTAGSVGYITDFWVSQQVYTKPVDGGGYVYAGPDGNIALTTLLEAPNIDINTDIDLAGTISERNFKANYGFTFSGDTYVLYDDPGAGNRETADLTLNTTGDVNVNANISMASMGDLNVTAVNYNVNGPAVVTVGSGSENVMAYVPPAPPVVADPTPPTVNEMIENITRDKVSDVKDAFFDDFASGSEEVVDQVNSVESLNTPLVTSVKVVSDKAPVVKAVAADCNARVCTVLDEENTLYTIEKTLLNKERSFFARLVDRAVNLRGMVDVVSF